MRAVFLFCLVLWVSLHNTLHNTGHNEFLVRYIFFWHPTFFFIYCCSRVHIRSTWFIPLFLAAKKQKHFHYQNIVVCEMFVILHQWLMMSFIRYIAVSGVQLWTLVFLYNVRIDILWNANIYILIYESLWQKKKQQLQPLFLSQKGKRLMM